MLNSGASWGYRVPSVMHRSFLSGAFALSLTGAALIGAPVQASSAPAASLQLSVREVQPPSDLDPSIKPLVPFQFKTVPAPTLRLASVSQGTASWYGPGFYGNRTASGEVFRPGTLTAAHRSLPFGTRVRVTNLNNGRSTVVRINDRGPFHGGRVIDLAHGAAHELGVTSSGVAPVRLEVVR